MASNESREKTNEEEEFVHKSSTELLPRIEVLPVAIVSRR